MEAQGRRRCGHGAGCAHNPDKRHAPMMLSHDRPSLSRSIPLTTRSPAASTRTPTNLPTLLPALGSSSTHRDMGPRSRYLGPESSRRGELFGRTRCTRSTIP